MKKRILSMLLAMVMVITMLPTVSITASAAGEHTHCICGSTSEETHTAIGDHNAFSTVDFAQAYTGQTSGTYYLASNITLSTIKLTGDLTICLNGNTISFERYISYGFWLNGHTLTITDCKGTGKVELLDGSTKIVCADANNSTFNLYGGTVRGSSLEPGFYVESDISAAFNQYGGMLTSSKDGIEIYGNCTFAQYAGTISATDCGIIFWSADGTLTLKTMPVFTGSSIGIKIYIGTGFNISKIKFDSNSNLNEPVTPVVIGTNKSTDGTITDGWKDLGITDFSKYFVPVEGAIITQNSSNELHIGPAPYAISKVIPEYGSFEVTDWYYYNENDIIDSAFSGDTIYVHPKPDDGYIADSVTYSYTTPSGTTTRTASYNKNFKYYSFYMPSYPVTIDVTFVVSVSSVTLDATSKNLTIDDTFTLTPTVLPENAANKNVNWSTSNQSVATVNDGVVTAIGEGAATITATAADGSGVSAACTVTVNAVTYTITKADAENGIVTVDKTTAAAGETVTITATPEEGYEVNTVSYTPAGGAETPVTAVEGVYSFTMPAESVTVSVTFKAPANDHTHCICGETHKAIGTHTTEENPTWTAISSADDFSKNKDSGYYYLTDDIEVSAKWEFTKSRDIVLCLNGHNITYTGNSKVSFIPGSTVLNLTLTDCQTNAGSISGFKNTAINVKNTFTMYNGKITGNTATQGGGVYVDQNATFYMYGGEITGNTASSLGGGVYIKGSMEVAGAPVVKDNANSNTATTYPSSMYKYTKNIYSSTGAIRVGTGGLTTGALLDVTPMFPVSSSEKPAAVVAIATGCTSDLSSYFTYTSGFEYIKQYDAEKDEVQLKYVAPPVPQVEVKFDMQGHGEQVPSQTIDKGTCATKPADPTAAGYRFLGWDGGYGTWDFGWGIEVDTTFYAKWVEKTVVSITESVQTCLWDGTEKAFEIKGTDLTGFTVQYYVGDIWTADAPSAVGSYDVKITRAEDNYYKAYEKVIENGFVIEKLVASVTTTPEANTLTYTGQEQELVTAGAASGGTLQYRLGESGAWGTEIPGATAAGSYTVYYKAVGDAAHDDSAEQSVNVTIGKAALTIKADHNSITYGDAPAANGVTYSGFVNGEDESVLAGTLGYTYGYTQGDNAGDYSITPDGLTGDNYEITFQAGTLTVGQKPITVTALDKRLRRNATAPDWFAPVEGEDYTVQGLLPGQTVTVTLSCAADMSVRGEFAIAPVVNDPSGNYAVTTINGVLTVYTVAASAADTTPVVSKTQGGAIAADKTKPAVGTEVTFKVTPDAGMQIDKVSVTYGGKEISVREKRGGVYAFFQPAGAVTIAVTFKPVGDVHVCPADSYHDVQADAWYHEAVDWVLSNGIMTGYSNTQFGPEDVLERAMVVQVLYNYEKAPTVSIQTLFNDVKAGQWYTDAVRWAAEKGIVAGYGDGNFGPNDQVTIEQGAVILWNYAGNPAVGAGDLAKVGNHSNWAATALRWAVDKGLLENVPFTNANEKATRAQTAQMLMNYLKNER